MYFYSDFTKIFKTYHQTYLFMNFRLFISLFLFSFSFVFLGKTQSANITEGCAGMLVDFSAPTPGNWSFGDGKSSNKQNAQNTYNIPGIYTVKFNEKSTGITIKVLEKPEIVITATPTKGCVPLNVVYNATLKHPLPIGVSIDNSTIVWNYQDGNNTTGSLTANYNYNSAGTKDLGFNLNFIQSTNTSCAKIDTVISKIIVASDKPTVNFSPDKSSACVAPLNVTFTNTSTSKLPLTYDWDFGNGNNSTKQNGDPQSYTLDGSYLVKLTVADNNGCQVSMTKLLTVGKPKASFFETTKKDTACVRNGNNSLNTYFTNKSTIGGYSWSFDAGTTPSSSSQLDPGPVFFSTPGIHKVKLTVNANGCSDDTTVNIIVQDPTINIGINRSYSCRDTLTSFYKITSASNSGPVGNYNWTFPDFNKTKKAKAFPSKTNTATPKCFYNTYDTTFSYRGINIDTVTLQYTTTAGCISNKATTVDTISEMWARFIPSVHQGCKDLTVTFSDSSSSHMKSKIDVWQWDFGDGVKQTINSKTSPKHTYTTPGKYYATLIVKDNEFNCADTSWKTEILVGDSTLAIDFTLSKTSICRGDSVKFTNTTIPSILSKVDAWNYSSNKEHLSACFQDKDGSFLINDTIGTHTITLSAEYNGCITKKTHTLDVKGPIAHFDYLQDCKTPNIIKLINKAQGTGTVNWKIGNNIISANTDTTTINLSTLNPKVNEGDIVIKQLITGGTCPDDSTQATIHFGSVKSSFILEDTLGVKLNPVNGKIILGDASTGQKYVFNATNSKDINPNDCFRGYTFLQDGERPREWNLAKDTFNISKNNNNKADNQIVQIIARNANNCIDTSNIQVRVFDINPKYITTIKSKISNLDTTVTSVCLPVDLTFDAGTSIADTTIKKYEWQFSDNTTATGKIVKHTFDASTQKGNSISVTLKITDENDFVKTTQTTIPIYKPTATITAIPAINLLDSTVSICENSKVKFTANSSQVLKYTWTYENGTKTNTNISDSPVFSLKNKQLNNKEKVIIDLVETATGCSEQTYRYVSIEKIPLALIKSNIVKGIGCGNPAFSGSFKDSSFFDPSLNPPCNYTWNLDNNTAPNNNPTTSLSYPKGKYSISLSLVTKANGCKKDTTIKFEVVSPMADFTISDDIICKGDKITFDSINPTQDVKTFRWDFGDGTNLSDVSPVTHTYNYLPNTATKTKVTLFVENNGCSNPIEKEILIQFVKANFDITDLTNSIIGDTSTCLGQSFSFTNSSVNSDVYKWSINNETKISKDIDSYTFPSVDTFDVNLAVTNNEIGCKDDITKKVIIFKLPEVNGVIAPVCIGKSTIKLTVANSIPKATYTWSPADLSPIKTTTYVVTVVDSSGCTSKDDVLAVVVEDIQPINWDTTIVIGDKIHLPIDNQYGTIDFTWTPNDGLSCLQCPKPFVQPLKDLVYTVVMKDNNNCGFSNNGIFNIKVKPETHLKLPTTFTPNGDGVNDVVYVKGWGVKTLETFEIYNRWGEVIYKSSNMEEGWDGYYKGELQNNDVYAYKVIGTSWKVDPVTGEDMKMMKEGYIHLMR